MFWSGAVARPIVRVLDVVIEGTNAAEIYSPAVERRLLSRLDHAAYLGKELARAEPAQLSGGSFIQDAAPEIENEPSTGPSTCGCGSTCGENHS